MIVDKKIKVSVILPSLNVKSYIKKCVDSVLNQTLKDIEIICVDAGSEDGTLEILEEYAKNDSRVKLIHSDVKSYGHQMNLGIENANGEYIGIVETDDFIDERMYDELYDLTDNCSVDIAKSSFIHFYSESDYKIDGTKQKVPKNKFTVFENAHILKGHPSIWAAIYKKSFLNENNIEFMEIPGAGWVDNPFLFRTILSARSIKYTDDAFYYYRELNPDSSTNDLRDLTLPMARMDNILDILEEYGCDDENILKELYIRIFWHTHDVLNNDYFKEQKNETILSFNKVFKRMDAHIVDSYFKVKDKKVFYKYRSPIFHLNSKTDLNELSDDELIYLKDENEFLYSHIRTLERNNKKLTQKNKKLNSKTKRLSKKIKNMENSKSYRLGFNLLSPFRAIKNFKKGKFEPCKLPPKKTPRILFIPSDNNKTSGAFLSMANLIVNLRDKYSLDIFVILPEKGQGQEILDLFNIPFQLIPSEDWVVPLSQERNDEFNKMVKDKQKRNKTAIKNIRKFIKVNDIDLIHINTTYSYVGAEAGIKERIPIVWHLREFLEEDQSNTLWDREKGNNLINRSNKIIAISDSIYNKYEKIFDNDKLIRIYNGIDSNKFYKENKSILDDDKLIFIMVGGFEYYKGQIEFAEACSKLYKNGFTNFEVWFIGTGRSDVKSEVQKICSSAGMDNVKYLGYKLNVEDYFYKSDISFTCAKSEAFGRTTVEAMLSGNLVIGADSAGTKELIADKNTGILYKHGSSDDLYEKILEAINNINKSKEIAKNGQKFMVENMTAEINADNVYKVYNEILKWD